MFSAQDLRMVHSKQADLRRDAAQQRLAKQHQTMEHHKTQDARRVFGLRLSLA